MQLLILAVGLLAQSSPENGPEFEVASIRMVKDDGHHDADSDKNFLRTHNLSLKRLIATAYGVDPRLVVAGPPWIDGDGFDINAKIPDNMVGQRRAILSLMLQNLLAERFQLVISREPRQVSGYALVVGKKGTHMRPAQAGQDGSSFNSHNTHLVAKNVTREAFARSLSRDRDIGMLVADKTGLSGVFDFELDWKPDPLDTKGEASNDDRPGLFTALQEQLGLRLESTKIPIQAIVVVKAEKPQEN